jgi:hypothetical protein
MIAQMNVLVNLMNVVFVMEMELVMNIVIAKKIL